MTARHGEMDTMKIQRDLQILLGGSSSICIIAYSWETSTFNKIRTAICNQHLEDQGQEMDSQSQMRIRKNYIKWRNLIGDKFNTLYSMSQAPLSFTAWNWADVKLFYQWCNMIIALTYCWITLSNSAANTVERTYNDYKMIQTGFYP